MGYLVTSVNNLKAIPCDTIKLRFVEQMKSWYSADPASTATPDDNRVIQPNVGSGRWIKQLSQVPNLSYTIQEVTTTPTVNAVAQVMYIIDALSIGTDCTFNLPTSPAIGDSVSVIKRNAFNFSEFRIIINPGSNNIEGVNSSFYLLDQNSHLELIWVGGTFGWLATRKPRFYSLAGSFTFAPPSGLLNTTTFNGVFDFAGKQYSTGGTWANPYTSSQIIITQGSNSGFNESQWFDRSVATANATGNTGIPSYWIVSFENTTRYATVQPSHILAVFSAASGWAGVTILGTNSNISTIPNYGNQSAHDTRQDFMTDASWEVIYKHNEARNGVSLTTRSDGHLAVAITANATKHYRHLMFLNHQSAATTVNDYNAREFEIWGTVNLFNK